MNEQAHLTDGTNLRMAVESGRVHQPRAQWEPDLDGWVVRARARQGGPDWVLSRGPGREPAFSSREQAWRAATSVRTAGTPYLVGRR
jgi:hypothetical protein